jgi:AraC-like DNA-binding protein
MGPQLTWSQTRNLPSRTFPHPVNWYLLGDSGKSARLQNYIIYRDNKLNSNDIAALLDLKDFLDICFLENPSLKELSYFSGLNNFKLKYGFRKLFGIPVKKYILDLRFEFARKLVRETNLPIMEVARKIGYRQLSSFSRTFRIKFGASPIKDRKLETHE